MPDAQRVPVLMYHRVGVRESKQDIYCIEPKVFHAHMQALADAGYQAISMEAFAGWLDGDRKLPGKPFLLTFDDGFMGVHTHAESILSRLGWPATVFLVAAKIGQLSDWMVTTDYAMKPYPLMGRAELEALHRLGWSLESHSLMHADLTTLSQSEALEDLSASREAIKSILGAAPRFLAYPYGRYNDQVRTAADKAGFELAFTVNSGFNRPGQPRLEIRRLDVFGSDTPAMLLRKISLGTNDGSLVSLVAYYLNRILARG